MHYRRLGRTSFNVSEVGYGAWGIGKALWIGANDRESLRALLFAIEHGVNFIDTALAYGDGHSERLAAQAVRDSGRRVYIATKVPPKNRQWPAHEGIGIEDAFPRDYVIRSTEESLRNLEVDTIDLQQLHVWNPAWLDREEWRRAFEDLKTSGKVRAFGVSINDHEPDSALDLIETGLIDAVQVIYNIFDPTAAERLLPACTRNNIGVIARVPFDEGALAGRITTDTTFPDGDFRNLYFQGSRKAEVEKHVYAIMQDLGLTELSDLAPLALRFCLSDPAVSTVIPGMRSIASVDANIAASGQGPLPTATLEVLRRHAWTRNFYMSA